jgi:site-specific DNA-methyltransferase (adenine-specific)
MTPNIEFYNEDCIELMKRYPDHYFDLAIVDPPYGNVDAIGLLNNKKKNTQAAKRSDYKIFDNVKPTDQYYIELCRVSKNQIIWGGNFLGLCGGVIAWNKNGTAFGEGEIAICSTHNSVRFFEYTWNGMIQGDMRNKETRIHPTQKPVALYKWLLKNYAKQGDKILDTHGGSMSSAIACYDMGFDLVITELDKDYYEQALKRFNNHTAQGSLFTAQEINFG